MSKDSYGEQDLFSFFGNGFSQSSEPKSEESAVVASGSTTIVQTDTQSEPTVKDSESEISAEGITNVVSLKERRINKGKHNPSNDGCSDSCDPEGNENDSLSEDESDALSDDEQEDETAADNAELTGGGVTKNDNKAVTPKAVSKPVFNTVTFICYAGITRPITKYFTEDQLAVLEMEDVRKRLEQDYPEMSKTRTKMEWDEKKGLIIPIITGGKKGAFLVNGTRGYFSSSKELHENMEPINIFATQDGFYEIRENPIGVFVAKADRQELEEWDSFDQFSAELPPNEHLESCREGFKLKLPKIPDELFTQLLSFFMDYAEHEVEVMGVFYWDSIGKRYILDVPFQSVSKVSVDPCYSQFPPNYIKVAEIHSHNTMKAFFSSIDNADELGTMLYAVIGRLKKGDSSIRFDIQTRAGVSGKFIPLAPTVWINGDYVSEDYSWNLTPFTPYPTKWQKRVTIQECGGELSYD